MQLCAAVAQKIMDECKGNSLMIFTDGAVCGGSVGSGSCAAVLFPLTRANIAVASLFIASKVSRYLSILCPCVHTRPQTPYRQ